MNAAASSMWRRPRACPEERERRRVMALREDRTVPNASGCAGCRAAVLVECVHEIVRDLLGGPPLYLPTLQHEDRLAVFHEGDLRRRRGVAGEIPACPGRGFGILPREHRR